MSVYGRVRSPRRANGGLDSVERPHLSTQRRNLFTFLGLLAFVVAVMVAAVIYIVRPLANSAEGPASVPEPGVLIVNDKVIHLDGLLAPSDDNALRGPVRDARDCTR